jgi:putative tricarboxylic transport membrane protein
LFGLTEALVQLHNLDKAMIKQKVDKIVPKLGDIKKYLPLSIQSSFIGVVIGALPGTGGEIASLMAYDHARRVTKKPEVPFGEGAKEGLIAAESSNNAAVGGAFIPMLTLGIPGDAVTAVFIGALFIHGVNPGPLLIETRPDMFWFIVGTLLLANVFLLIFGLTGIKVFSKIIQCPKGILIPIIFLLSIVGAYSIHNSVSDIWWMLAFGVMGYFMRRHGYPLSPIILGVILSHLMDENWRRAILVERNDLGAFWANLFSSPLSLTLLFIIVFVALSSTPFWRILKQKISRK